MGRPRVKKLSLAWLVSLAAAALAALTTSHARSSPTGWASASESPRAVASSSSSSSDRESALAAACGKGDAALRDVAQKVLAEKLRGAPTLDEAALAAMTRMAGEPHVWPRAWVVSGRALSEESLRRKLAEWIASAPGDGARRCGVAFGSANANDVAVVVTVDALADLAALPVRAHAGQWLTVDAQVLVAATGARVIVMGPYGAPRSVPVSFERGRVRARFAPDAPGAFTVQVMADLARGPRPVLEASVFADVEPPASLQDRAAPGEEAASTSTDDVGSLDAMLAAMRRAEKLVPFTRDARLDALARAHATKMLAANAVAHDAGDGDPSTRLRDAGLTARDAGENVAHAKTIALAHRALYASPSHRANMLRSDFDRAGVSVMRGADGSVWVTELFASGLR